MRLRRQFSPPQNGKNERENEGFLREKQGNSEISQQIYSIPRQDEEGEHEKHEENP